MNQSAHLIKKIGLIHYNLKRKFMKILQIHSIITIQLEEKKNDQDKNLKLKFPKIKRLLRRQRKWNNYRVSLRDMIQKVIFNQSNLYH